MKKYLLLLLALSSLLTVACDRKISGSDGKGTLSLKINSDNQDYIDIPTRADVDVSTFKVVLKDSQGTPISSWNTYAEVPSSINLSPGTYTVEAYSPETEPAAFDQPVYRGEDTFEILSGKLTTANVVCSLDNVKVTVTLGDTFTSEVKDYTITVRAVNYNKSLVFTKDIIDAGTAGYFSVSPLEIHIIGKRVLDNSEVNEVKYINDVNSRDHLILNINARATGSLGSLTITVDYGTNDRNEDIDVPGFTEDPVDGNDPDPEPEPEPETKPVIDFSCEDEVTFSDSQAADAVVDVTVSAEKGISNLFVEIKSETLLGMLGSLGLGDEVASGNWDIANVTDLSLKDFLGGLGLYSEEDPIKGKKSHTFSIGSFMALMSAQDDPYPFVIKVVDAEGNETSRTLTIYRVK